MTDTLQNLTSKIRWLDARIERLEEAVPKTSGPQRARVEERLIQLRERRDNLAMRLDHMEHFGFPFGDTRAGAEFAYEAVRDSFSRYMTRWL